MVHRIETDRARVRVTTWEMNYFPNRSILRLRPRAVGDNASLARPLRLVKGRIGSAGGRMTDLINFDFALQRSVAPCSANRRHFVASINNAGAGDFSPSSLNGIFSVVRLPRPPRVFRNGSQQYRGGGTSRVVAAAGNSASIARAVPRGTLTRRDGVRPCGECGLSLFLSFPRRFARSLVHPASSRPGNRDASPVEERERVYNEPESTDSRVDGSRFRLALSNDPPLSCHYAPLGLSLITSLSSRAPPFAHPHPRRPLPGAQWRNFKFRASGDRDTDVPDDDDDGS